MVAVSVSVVSVGLTLIGFILVAEVYHLYVKVASGEVILSLAVSPAQMVVLATIGVAGSGATVTFTTLLTCSGHEPVADLTFLRYHVLIVKEDGA